ncbi:hypothetical protein AFLA_003813 [Aspergillus flavus NRRL3357]|nr:uncharacterized protein G4B84_001166 [Aspergillus flavus NRRL3357]KAF7628457.1 hypothetical protein AFLA_003813 [Aspergillus flavus NRRL3357]QMW25921.1 hypothetical protein G4B84_001166 [Aspergillus flavus NRRL3357]RAQ49583.1 hypothetical protein AFGD_002634 [Aspergillus flavus]
MSIQALPQTLPPSTNPTQTIDRYEPSWYQPTLPRLPETARQIFRDYSHIPEDNILEHIYRVRNKAWDVLPYPCIGVFRFLDFGANLSPIYPEVIQRLRAGQTFLDLGCCFGQDIRKLVHDGAPSENIIGADTEGRFMDLGYELFRDKDTLKARFYAASVFDEEFLSEWHGKIDIIYVGAFLHLFDIEKQALVVARLVELLRRRPGSIVFGRNLGAERGGAFRMKTLGWDVFRHSRETMRLLWEGAPEGDWRVDAELMEYRSEGWDDSRRGWVGDETKEMRFVVRRL